MKRKTNITDLLQETKCNNTYVKVCAPMVRYSKVQFRTLVKNYGVNLCFTPMIIADSFCQNTKARCSEFTTTLNDTPLIVQFAANNVNDFVDASKLVYPYADGVDLNCGCPQKWAMKDGYGCALLAKPQIIQDLVNGVRNSLPSDFSISVKLRVLKDLKRTIDICQKLEKCGVNFLTVHGRTPEQKTGDDINTEAIRQVCDSVDIPVIANGGIKTLEDSDELFEATKCNGVMAASGILTNPSLFTGANKTPASCVKMWMSMKDKHPDKITYQVYHHHLVFMLEKVLTKQQKQVFNHLSSFESVDEYLCQHIINVENDLDERYDIDDFVTCDFPVEIIMKHSSKCRGCGKSVHYCVCSKYSIDATDGSFFSSFVRDEDGVHFMDTNMFNDPV